MTSARLIRTVALHGARLEVEEGQLVLYGSDRIPPTLKDALKRNKDALLALLAEDLDRVPLSAKLRAYGEPYPLMVDDRVAAWLVPDKEAAQAVETDEPIYTASEVEGMAQEEQEGA